MQILKPGDKFDSSIGTLRILEFLGKGKSGYSYLSEMQNSEVVLKLMHNEPNPYYTFTGNKVEAERDSYNQLTNAGISVPALITSEPDENYLIKEFIPGKVASELIAEAQINEQIFSELFKFSTQAKLAGFNIDYFPNNFVINSSGALYYIDYETNEYTDQWNLENWGIYYWVNSEGFGKFLKTGDASYINSDPGKGIPLKDKFEKHIRELIVKHSQ